MVVKKIFVIGGFGFIGICLIELLGSIIGYCVMVFMCCYECVKYLLVLFVVSVVQVNIYDDVVLVCLVVEVDVVINLVGIL